MDAINSAGSIPLPTPPAPIETLPPEVLLQIIRHLPDDDLVKVELLSHRFREVTSDLVQPINRVRACTAFLCSRPDIDQSVKESIQKLAKEFSQQLKASSLSPASVHTQFQNYCDKMVKLAGSFCTISSSHPRLVNLIALGDKNEKKLGDFYESLRSGFASFTTPEALSLIEELPYPLTRWIALAAVASLEFQRGSLETALKIAQEIPSEEIRGFAICELAYQLGKKDWVDESVKLIPLLPVDNGLWNSRGSSRTLGEMTERFIQAHSL
ncbi:MAG: F-box protein [Chlamydiia bacterium]|nr:F-box protein [Chlamydiia bacterium]